MYKVEETDKTKRGFIRDILKDFVVPFVVCIASVIVTLKTNEIYKLQLLIAKNSELPTIKVIDSYTINDSSSLDDTVEIFILDRKYNNYKSEIVTFLEFSFENMDGESFNKVELPVRHYYSIYDNNNNLYGNIETLHGSREKYETLLEKCEAYYNKRKSLTLITSIHSYLKITYLNLLAEEEIIIYLIVLFS